jgi:hypothetical protein
MSKPAELILERFCGRETYPLLKGTWSIFHDEELDTPTLCIQIHAGSGTSLHDDTQSLRAEPWWEINVLSKALDPRGLKPGDRFFIPRGYDEAQGGYITNFYYWSHEQTDDNVIELLAVEGSKILVSMTGKTIDVNFYDGSKPPTTLRVEAWLTHDEGTRRSMT